MLAAADAEAYANILSRTGTSLEAESPGLKLASLLTFVWLLFESRHAPRQSITAVAAGRGPV